MDFLQWISEVFQSIFNALMSVLPKSPIVYLQSDPVVSKYIGYLNYFIPVYLWISVLQSWLLAVGIYYCYKLILRWIKAE